MDIDGYMVEFVNSAKEILNSKEEFPMEIGLC